MNYKMKKIVLISSLSLGVAAIVGTSIGLYFATPGLKRISKEGLYVIRTNASSSEYAYKYDTSATYGNAQSNTLTVLLANELVHLKSEGKIEIVDGKIKTPSFQSIEFSLAEAVVVRIKNKNDDNDIIELVFDSDDSEYPSIPSDNNQTIMDKISSNKRSINNKEIFKKLLTEGAIKTKVNSTDELEEANITKDGDYIVKNVGFVIRENTKWVDSKGNETEYNVVADDFWYSFMRTKLFDKDYRRANGGSEELDKHFIKTYNATTRFQERDRFPNEYLYSFFDLDSTKLYNRSDVIMKLEKTNDEKYKNKEAFFFTSLNASEQSDNTEHTDGFIAIFNKILANNTQLSAAPSEYIKKLAKSNEINNIGKDLTISGKAREFGIYTYGIKRHDVLYASPYIPKIVNENQEIFEYNKYYANRKWVELVEKGKEITLPNGDKQKNKALRKIIFEYSNGIDTSTFNSQAFNSYMNGTTSEILYSTLNPNQKQLIYGNGSSEKIQENAARAGLQYTKTLNTSNLVQRTLVQSNPIHGVSENQYLFNEEYSKLVFGATRKELSDGTANTTNSFFKEKGFEFRLLIQASINWYAYIKQAYSDQRVMWLNGAAQDAKFTSKSTKSPIDYFEKVNTLEFIDRTSTEKKFISVTPEEMKEHALNNATNNKIMMQSPKFDLIKKNMDALLKDVNGNLEWEIVYPYDDKNQVVTTIMKSVVETIESLNPKLKPKLVIPKNKDEMIIKINSNLGISDFNGWGYDYEGIGSYIGAFSNGHGVTIFNSFALYSEENPTDETIKFLQKSFPEFTKLSKYIKQKTNEYMKNHNIDQKFYVENWKNVTNKDNQEVKDFFKVDGKVIYDPAVELPKILRAYENENITDDSWAELIKELNAIKGVSLDADNSILDPTQSNLSLYLREYIIPVTKYGIQYFQDYRVVEDKK